MQVNRDVISGAALLLLGLLYFIGALGLPEGRDEPGPAFFPLLLSVSLLLLAVWILVQGFAAGSAPETKRDDDVRGYCWKPVGAVALTALYAASFQWLGFVLSTVLYTFFVTTLFRRLRLVVRIGVPIVSTALIYILFRLGLGVRLPAGLLPLG